MKKIFIAIIVIVLALGALTYFLKSRPVPPATQVTDQPNTAPTATVEPFISGTPDMSSLLTGGNSYLDPQGVYAFLYPNDYAIDQQDGETYTRISKRGATQQGQTEMYDGVIVVFERVNLEGKSLEDVVDARIQQSAADGTTEVTQPKKATTLNDYSGFTYETRGLGSSTNLIVQKSAQSTYAVNITFLVADPEQKGYQTEVDRILSTLELRQ